VSYRIGGSVKLLLDGVEPEVIMKLGGWMSLCFLIYWRRLELVLSSRIAKAWDSRIRDFAAAHGHAYDSDLSRIMEGIRSILSTGSTVERSLRKCPSEINSQPFP
jgi:hypothetical protein